MTAPSKESKIADLKKNLTQLQDKIADLEDKPRRAQIKELFTWSAPSRVYRKKNKRWVLNLILLVLIILVILLFLKQFILMAVVLSMAFLGYVVDAVPPEEVSHTVTSQGINTGERSYLWEELYDFWFFQKSGFTVLAIDTMLNYPRRLFLLVDAAHEEKIKKLLASYIPFREQPNISWLDRWGDKLANQFHNLVGS